MSTRKVFSDSEKTCLKELVVKYKLHKSSNLTVACQSVKKVSWRRLTEDFNSIETNTKRTESQLKKCYDNLKTRHKISFINKAMRRRRIRTDREPCNPNVPQLGSNTDPLKTEPVCDETDGEIRSVIDNNTIDPSEDLVNIKEEVADISLNIEIAQRHDIPSQRVSPLRQATEFRTTTGSPLPESINVRSKAIEEELSLKQIAHEEKERREDELHKMIMKENEWMVKAAEQAYFKAQSDRDAAEEFFLCRRAERKLAEYELKNKIRNNEI